jgi:hypothetical protein
MSVNTGASFLSSTEPASVPAALQLLPRQLPGSYLVVAHCRCPSGLLDQISQPPGDRPVDEQDVSWRCSPLHWAPTNGLEVGAYIGDSMIRRWAPTPGGCVCPEPVARTTVIRRWAPVLIAPLLARSPWPARHGTTGWSLSAHQQSAKGGTIG